MFSNTLRPPATKLARHPTSYKALLAASLNSRYIHSDHASNQTSTASKAKQSTDSGKMTENELRNTNNKHNPAIEQHKSQAELDKELAVKMAGIAGDGGSAGVEYEDGQPVAMKRGVKSNMFRLI